MPLTIHIGSQKTGSTAIQTVLANNSEALRANGFHYLEAGRNNIAHNALAQDLRHGDPKPVFDAIADEVTAHRDTHFLMSSEMLFHSFVPGPLSKGLAATQYGSVRIVCYLRRHDQYLEAMYKQLLKNGKIQPDPEGFLQRRLDTAAYGPVLDRFADVFGHANVRVCPFEKTALEDGDIVTDFLSQIGVDDLSGFERPALRTNQTFSAEVTEILGDISRHTRINTRAIIRALSASGNPDIARAGDAFDSPATTRILQETAADADYVLATYRPDLERLFESEPGDHNALDTGDALTAYKTALTEVLAALGRTQR